MAFDHGLVTKFTTLGVAAATLGVAIWGFFVNLSIENIMNCTNLMCYLFYNLALFP
jgi:multisubunit Na+/H+ antiporter MnhG subunit